MDLQIQQFKLMDYSKFHLLTILEAREGEVESMEMLTTRRSI